MDIDQLRTFDRIAREGSFTKAAARLNVTQATVSMRMRTLEDQLGGALFERGRKMRLTERGTTFLPYARRILTTLLEGEDALRSAQRGHVTVATLRSLAAPLVGNALVRFAEAHPLTEVIIAEGHHHDVAERVHDRGADLAVMGWPNLDPLLDDIEPIAIFREPVRLAVAPWLADEIGPEPTLDRVFAVVPRYLLIGWWQVYPDAVSAMRFRAKTVSTVSIGPALALAEAGHGIGYFVETALAPVLAAGRLAVVDAVDAPVIHRDTALVSIGGGLGGRPLVAELARLIDAEAAALGMGRSGAKR